MSRKYKGMQLIIKEGNRLVEEVPCVAYSINFVRKRAAECYQLTVYFFVFIRVSMRFFQL